jgi:hypothetical protein
MLIKKIPFVKLSKKRFVLHTSSNYVIVVNGRHSYENPVAANHDSQVIIVRVSRRLTQTVVVNHQTTTGYSWWTD